MSAYTSYLYVSYHKTVAESEKLEITPTSDVSDRYDQNAPCFDSDVDFSEYLMGMGKLRKGLVQMAKGDVCEVSCGTGRNMKYYLLGEKRRIDAQDGRSKVLGCKSLTFVDRSGGMLEIARRQFEEANEDWLRDQKVDSRGKIAFRAQDATQPIKMPYSVNKSSGGQNRRQFDTIVQTMGLCSVYDPVAFLKHLSTIVKPEKGQILLLEHGRVPQQHWWAKYVNKLLDELAKAHANRHGCWWNRDLDAIVEESGLRVVSSRRYHLGTTAMFVLEPANAD